MLMNSWTSSGELHINLLPICHPAVESQFSFRVPVRGLKPAVRLQMEADAGPV